MVRFNVDGSAHAQYGATPGDAGILPSGTVDFVSLVDYVSKADRNDIRTPDDRYQIAIRRPGETTLYSFTLVDDAAIHRVLLEVDTQWTQHPLGTRFDQLRQKSPIVTRATSEVMHKTADMSALHVVQHGDTLSGIARQYYGEDRLGEGRQAIINANPQIFRNSSAPRLGTTPVTIRIPYLDGDKISEPETGAYP